MQMLSHIDLSPSDMLLAFSLAMALQRIQRKRVREERQRLSLPAEDDGEEDGEEAPSGAALGSAGGPAAAALGTEATVESGGSPQGQQQQQQQQQPGGIQLSEQSSPDRAASVCSLDDLLPRGVHDLEAGLLGRRRGIGGVGSSSKGAAGDLGTDSLESFVPRRPVADSMQVGAGKTAGGPHWQLQAGDSKAGEQGTVDAGESRSCQVRHCLVLGGVRLPLLLASASPPAALLCVASAQATPAGLTATSLYFL